MACGLHFQQRQRTPDRRSASNNQSSDVAVYPDGRMLITGYCDDSGSAKFCVTRLTLAGALDTSFNSTGIKLYSATGQTGDVTRRVRILPGDASFSPDSAG